jgi:hypothetical protein
LLRKHFAARKIVKCRDHQTLGQIAGGAKDDQRAGIGRSGLVLGWARYQPCARWSSDRCLVKHGGSVQRGLEPFPRARWVLALQLDRRNRNVRPTASFRRRGGSCRERKWVNSAAVITSAATASSIATSTVQRSWPNSKFMNRAFAISRSDLWPPQPLCPV